ncbi:MAG: ATP-binding protein [Clostridiaceae bacterium]|nr:ATP-binding protein [Clostridiaceae bacterium]
MLRNETIHKLKSMRLSGFALALEDQYQTNGIDDLDFDTRLGLLVDREYAQRKNNRIQRLISQAKFRDSNACIEDINYRADRKLDRQMILELATCQYIPLARNVNIFGATGAGKSYLGQALGNAACRKGIKTRYVLLPDLFEEYRWAEHQGVEKLMKFRKLYTNVPLLIIDEWLLFRINEEECQILLQIIDRRSARKSTIVISQFDSHEWLDQMPIQVAAEAITDRLTAQAYTITIEAKESMRML